VATGIGAQKQLTTLLAMRYLKTATAKFLACSIFHNDRFIQVLEGQPDDLNATMSIIHAARSHNDIEILANDPIQERSFALWNMGQLNFSNCQDVDPTFFKKVVELYKTILMPRADRLIETYQLLVRDKEFANLI